jgi:NADP-dependent 3-hydroxy acid dehydrogenase YdfG
MMPEQTAAEQDFALARSAIETNYLGAVRFFRILHRSLRARRGGHIVVLGSVAGDRGQEYLYGSTKAAVHVYVEGLRTNLLRRTWP